MAKRLTERRPEQAGPAARAATKNKQQVTRLTRRERLSALSGGVIDSSIPEEQWRHRLEVEPKHTFNLDQITARVWSEIAIARGFSIPGERDPIIPPRLEPAEIVKQAAQTTEAIDEVIDRLDALHPELAMHADDVFYRAHGEIMLKATERAKAELYRIRAAVLHAGKQVTSTPGPKGSPWHQARDVLAQALLEYSDPPIAKKAARPLAEDLLELCELRNPRKRARQ